MPHPRFDCSGYSRRIDIHIEFLMSNKPIITKVSPEMALPGAEIEIELEGFIPQHGRRHITVNGQDTLVVASSARRILARVPENSIANIPIRVWNPGGEEAEPGFIQIPTMIAEDMHVVANPAIRPSDDSIFVTYSGSRGQIQIAYIYRIDLVKGFTEMIVADVQNATGLAFSPDGHLYATDRHNGRLYRVNPDDTEILVAENLGIATGLAFGPDGLMYVGDRTGTIYKVDELGTVDTFATLEPSVAAYHLAFGPDGYLYVTAPSLASSDFIYRISPDGEVSVFAKGFGRPQGLAFDTDGNLYVVACHEGRHGVVRISPAGEITRVVSGDNLVGLCFTRDGEMIVATSEKVYIFYSSFIDGTLLPEREDEVEVEKDEDEKEDDDEDDWGE